MPGLELLDLAISLVFLFLLLSLICSVLTEFVEALWKKRSAQLLQGIKEMLNDPDGKVLVDKLYEHTFIFSLYKGSYHPASRNLPSYIPPGNFVAALLGVLVPDAQGKGDIGKLKESINRIENDKVRIALTQVVNETADDMEQARANMEAWYQSSMERVSGWYKRHAQFVTLALGFFLAVAVNADTIGVATDLTRDRAMRSAFVAVAQGYAQRPPGGDAVKGFNELFNEVQQSPAEIGVPIGWNDRTIPQSATAWFLKLIGWFLSAAATSLGASFWFDTLKNLVNLRATLKPESAKSANNPD